MKGTDRNPRCRLEQQQPACAAAHVRRDQLAPKEAPSQQQKALDQLVIGDGVTRYTPPLPQITIETQKEPPEGDSSLQRTAPSQVPCLFGRVQLRDFRGNRRKSEPNPSRGFPRYRFLVPCLLGIWKIWKPWTARDRTVKRSNWR